MWTVENTPAERVPACRYVTALRTPGFALAALTEGWPSRGYSNVGRASVVVLPEEIDITNAGAMREELCSAFSPGVAVVIADMTSTAFCDTSCFRNLLIAHADAHATGAQLRLVILPGGVRRVLKLLGLDRQLSVYPSVDSARIGDSARDGAQASTPATTASASISALSVGAPGVWVPGTLLLGPKLTFERWHAGICSSSRRNRGGGESDGQEVLHIKWVLAPPGGRACTARLVGRALGLAAAVAGPTCWN
jgi:anti-sigma B factor antagonist